MTMKSRFQKQQRQKFSLGRNTLRTWRSKHISWCLARLKTQWFRALWKTWTLWPLTDGARSPVVSWPDVEKTKDRKCSTCSFIFVSFEVNWALQRLIRKWWIMFWKPDRSESGTAALWRCLSLANCWSVAGKTLILQSFSYRGSSRSLTWEGSRFWIGISPQK